MGAAVSALNNVGYSTQKQVVIKSWSLSLLYYSILAVVFAYVVGFTLVVKKGYQATVPAVGSVALKVKGIASRANSAGDVQLWDASDLTIYDATSVFVATNIMRTEQARGTCLGMNEDEACELKTNSGCEEGFFSRSGRQTGRCVAPSDVGVDENTGEEGEEVEDNSDTDTKNATSKGGRCQVTGWCPAEPEDDIAEPLENVGNFTIFLRTDVRFPGMRDKHGRTFDVTNANGTVPTPGWNLFTLDEILQMGDVEYDDIALSGADIQMTIYYDCDLDQELEACQPRVPFEVIRIDTADSELSHGYNTRWLSAVSGDLPVAPDVTYEKNPDTRALVKAVGPRIRVQITGQGRRFDLEQTTTVVGAGVALMGIATVVVDVLLLYVLPRRTQYFGLKYTVYGSDEGECAGEAEQPRRSESEEPLLA